MPAPARSSASSPSIAGDSVGTVDPPTTTRESESLFGLESGVEVSTVAVLVIAPEDDCTVTTIVTVALPPFGIVPRVAVTVPAAFAQEPWLGEQETNATPAGSGSVTVTAAALAGPALATRIV